MDTGKGGDAPEVPDYAAIAESQGKANVEAAKIAGLLNNPNHYTPVGNRQITFGQGDFDQAGYDAAMGAYNQSLANFNNYSQNAPSKPIDPATWLYGSPSQISEAGGIAGTPPTILDVPNRNDFYSSEGQPTIVDSLSPEEQAIFNTNQRTRGQLATIGEQGIGRVKGH